MHALIAVHLEGPAPCLEVNNGELCGHVATVRANSISGVAITVNEIGEATVVMPGSHVGVVEVEDCLLLIDEGAGRGYPLNLTGSLVWQLLGSPAPLGELIEDLSAAYGAERPDVAHDVIGLVRNFGSLGLLEGVFRSLESVPIDIEFVDDDECNEPDAAGGRRDDAGFDARYLAAPPNA